MSIGVLRKGVSRMSASRGWQRHSRKRKRIIVGAISAVAIVVAVLLLIQACGSSGGSNLAEDGTSATEGGRAGGGGGDGSGGANGEEPTTGEPEVEQPYAALEPAENATPLSENVTAADTELAVGTENGGVVIEQYEDEDESGATGGTGMNGTGMDSTGSPAASEPSRSVPLGQTLLRGEEDDSDGPLKDNRIVAYYGTPASNLMGILGEYEPEEMMRRLKAQTQAYSNADPDRPAIPAIEFIASIAQRDPGPDNLYVASADPADIRQYSELAKENDALLILDVQLGRASVMDEVRILEPFLKQPHVQLAIDTEYAIEEGQVPGVDLGSVDGSEIQEAVEYLDRMVEEEGIPDKLLMVHQFDLGIVTSKQEIRPTENVEVVLHADGFGGPEAKFSKYGMLVRAQPMQYGAFKVFYQQDAPVLEPSQVLALDPAPAIVTYQ